MKGLRLTLQCRRFTTALAVGLVLAALTWVLPLEPPITLDSSVSVPARPISFGEITGMLAAATIPSILTQHVPVISPRQRLSRALTQYVVSLAGILLALLPGVAYWVRFHQATPQADTASLGRFVTTAALYAAIGILTTRVLGTQMGPVVALIACVALPITQNYLPNHLLDTHLSAGLHGGQHGWHNLALALLAALPKIRRSLNPSIPRQSRQPRGGGRRG